MARYRERRGYRSVGANITMTSVGISLAIGAALYMLTGVSLIPVIAMGLLTFTPVFLLSYRGRLLEGLGAALLMSSFSGSLVYMVYLAGDPSRDPLYTLIQWDLTPYVLVFLGLLSGGIASYLGSIYGWSLILESLQHGYTGPLYRYMLAWSMLIYVTVLSIPVLKSRSLRNLVLGRSSLIIFAGASSLIIMYTLTIIPRGG